MSQFGDEFGAVKAERADVDPPPPGADVAGLDATVTDPAGPGNPVPRLTVAWKGSSANKVAVMASWIVLLAAIAGASLQVLRRRQTRS